MRHLFKIFTVLIIGTMLLVPGLAFAAPDYSIEGTVPVDPFTGEEIYDDPYLNNTITIARNCVYQRSEGAYIYTTSALADSQIQSSAFDGMITASDVYLRSGKNSNMVVYRNGENLGDGVNTTTSVTTPGEYKVFSGSDEIFSFTIVGKKTSLVHSYSMPSGFSINSVMVDGANIPFNSQNIEFEKEGLYEIHYTCNKTNMDYTLITTIDYTPTTIELVGVKNGIARGPVKIEGLEQGATLSINLNGESIPSATELKQSGEYRVIVSDAAGNKTTYDFVIKVYFNLSAWMSIALLVIVIGAVVFYIIYSRKHLRIR